MDKLFFVPQRRSILQTALFAVFLEFTNVSKCVSSQELCIPSIRRNVSYFNVDTTGVDWNTARQECIARKSILPVICNKDEQDALINHLNANKKRSIAWTSGKKINFDNWTWIDGNTFIGNASISPGHQSYTPTHVALDENRNYKAANPQHKIYYLCQFPDTSCNSENVINLTLNGCVIPSDDDQTWFNARNQCLKNGSDLAILTDADLDTLKSSKNLPTRRSYWIGLRQNAWHWIWQGTAKFGKEIVNPNWPTHSSSQENECISIDASDGEWKAVSCTDKYKVVCEISASGIRTQNDSDSNVNSQFLLYSGVGAGIVIIVVCSIIIILAVLKTKKLPENNIEQNMRDGYPNKPDISPASVGLHANAPVTEADDMRGVYAEISLASLNKNNPDETETEQQPGTVYASLEFHEETHLLD